MSVGVIVQKFGGTSVANPDLRSMAIGHIRKALDAGKMVTVVVSAMGRQGQPYATDTLLSLVGAPRTDANSRDVDMLLCCGEVISAVLMSDALCRAGIPAVALTGGQAGIVTDAEYGDAHILEVKPDRLRAEVTAGRVPVVAGFQGATLDGDLTTLGRGGSDTTAAALGVALAAEVVEIFTDVEGVMTADPRVCRNARVLDTVTYREVAEMAHLGAKVIHSRAVEIAMEGRVPLRVRCTSSDAPGTLITDVPRADSVAIYGDKVVTGIASLDGMALVCLSAVDNAGKNTLAVFRRLAAANVSVDLISVSPVSISFIVREAEAEAARQSLEEMELSATVEPGFAKVSAVGAGMRGVPGVMARVVDSLAAAGVSIYETSDSHTMISCLVRQEAIGPAVQALHEGFGLS